MRIAFYAPLKPLDHPNPSGDRLIGRLLRDALMRAGHEVEIAARLRTRDGVGDLLRQDRLRRLSEQLADRYLRRGARPDVWFTYHVYYKAPDWIGPLVARELGIPYIVAEASHAPKRAGGKWDTGHRGVEAGLQQADRIVSLNRNDMPCVRDLIAEPDRVVYLPPFVADVPSDVRDRAFNRQPLELLTVAMMRPGDKLESYRQLAAALAPLSDGSWRLTIVGDGAARADVEAILPPSDQIRYLGQLEHDRLAAAYADADLFVWPAVNEAFGMVFLEAQAAGLPIIAGNTGGVPGVVADGKTGLLSPVGDVAALTHNLGRIMSDPDLRRQMSSAARQKVMSDHHIDKAAHQLDRWLREAVEEATCR